MAEVRSFGSWKSPITADLIVKDFVKFLNILHDNKNIYFAESRPKEKGRSQIVKYDKNNFEEVLNNKYNARTKVHEYGGLSFFVNNGDVYFSNFEDQRIYKKDISGNIKPITSKSNDRYADFIVDEKRDLIFAVQEKCIGKEIHNHIVKIQNGRVSKIQEGRYFYSSLCLSPNGKKLAFLAWDLPDMPWDAAELWIADIGDNGDLKNLTKIAGSKTESVFQPRWSKNNDLYFISDKTNWWNLYRYRNNQIEAIYEMDAEFGYPQWIFGLSRYDFYETEDKTYIFAVYTKNGKSYLAKIDVEEKSLKKIEIDYTSFFSLCVFKDNLYFIGASPKEEFSIVALNLKTHKSEIIKRSRKVTIDPGYISYGQHIDFPTSNNKTAYLIYYPPQNKDFTANKEEKPPLIVISHGGPTRSNENIIDLKLQYWTSRGFAVADVNYRGSTGHGREYRESLYGNWGIYDIEDVCNAANYLVAKGLADPDQLIIRGSSAGGYTTLGALTFKDTFKAGASYYGVSNIETLFLEAPKFESKYEEKLIGPYPEKKQLFFERSPINFIDRLKCPIILFQGEDDKIVPPNQSERMFNAIKQKNIPTAYLLFEKEGHGFRSADVIKRCLEAELYFYSKIFNFEFLEENFEPLKIENMD